MRGPPRRARSQPSPRHWPTTGLDIPLRLAYKYIPCPNCEGLFTFAKHQGSAPVDVHGLRAQRAGAGFRATWKSSSSSREVPPCPRPHSSSAAARFSRGPEASRPPACWGCAPRGPPTGRRATPRAGRRSTSTRPLPSGSRTPSSASTTTGECSASPRSPTSGTPAICTTTGRMRTITTRASTAIPRCGRTTTSSTAPGTRRVTGCSSPPS